MNQAQSPGWHFWALRLAAVHCAVWGIGIILLPQPAADVYGLGHQLTDDYLWQGTGLAILLFGVGYGIASMNPLRHWAVVAVGLLGKVLGPIGMIWAVTQGDVSTSVLPMVLINDVIWWFPFVAILRNARLGNMNDLQVSISARLGRME